jgi:O-antigen/teichoic acid export membrane protein
MNDHQAGHDVGKKALTNLFFSGIRLAINVFATIFTSAILARSLGPSETGTYGYAIWLVGTLAVIANVGIPSALSKYISEFAGRGELGNAAAISRKLIRFQLWIVFGLGGIVAIAALLSTSRVRTLLLVALLLFPQVLQRILTSTLEGLQQFKKIATISFFVAIVQVISVGTAALLHCHVVGMLWATIFGTTAGTLLFHFPVRKFLQGHHDPNSIERPLGPGDFRRIRRFSVTVSYVLCLDMIVWQRSEVIFLKWYSSLAEIAFYTLAYSVSAKLSDIASAFSSTLLPLYSETYGRSGLQDLSLIYRNALKYVQFAMVPACIFGAASAPVIVKVLYGATYAPMTIPLQLLLLSLAITSTGMVGSPLVVGTERQSFIAKYGTVTAIINLTLDFVLIPRYGAIGAAIANCSAQLIGVLGGNIYITHYLKKRFPWKDTFAIYSAAIASALVILYATQVLHARLPLFAVSLLLGVTIYLSLIFFGGLISNEDKDFFRQMISRKLSTSRRTDATLVG